MIESLVSDVLNKIGHMVRVDGKLVEPTEDVVRKLLDSAIKSLYDAVEASGQKNIPVGATIEFGGVVLVKSPKGFDVYAYVGEYI